MDALALGAIFRAVRIRHRWRQADVAARAGVSGSTVSRIERGRIGSFAVDTVLRLAAALEIRVDFQARWRGGELDRMLNAGHAAMHEALARLVRALPEWVFATEVTFAVYGERGVIDVLGFHARLRALLVIELKTDLVDVQHLIASLDRYRRLAPKVARERGWNPATVSCWVVFRDTATNRRRVTGHATVLRAAFPGRAADMRRWLRQPAGTVAGLSFLSDLHVRTGSAASSGVRRIRKHAASV